MAQSLEGYQMAGGRYLLRISNKRQRVIQQLILLKKPGDVLSFFPLAVVRSCMWRCTWSRCQDCGCCSRNGKTSTSSTSSREISRRQSRCEAD